MIGRVDWRSIIQECQAVGLTPSKLGEMLGRDKETVIYWRDTPTAEPKHSDGVKLLAIHAEHAAKNFAIASPAPTT